MTYKVVLDTTLCDTQPDRVQQYLSNNLTGLDVWAAPRLNNYPRSLVRVYRLTEVEVMNARLVGGKVEEFAPVTTKGLTTAV